MSLWALLVPYPVRRQILQSLLAYDIAKLEVATGGFLSPKERQLYLQPLHDLVEDIAEVRALEAYGMRLLLLGNDVSALQQRLKSPQDYIRRHNQHQKLTIYLVGLCPVFTKTTGIRDRILTSSLFGTRNAQSVFEDTNQIRRLKARVVYESLSQETMFIMSLGASHQQSAGFWVSAQTVPDSTIDLKLYVPSFLDRQRGEVCFPYRECRIAKVWSLSYLEDLFRVYLHNHVFSAADLSSQGLRVIGNRWCLCSPKQINIQTAVLNGNIY